MIKANRTTRIGLAAALLLAATVITGLYLGIETRNQFGEIASSWTGYAENAEKKGAWISSIRGYLGYGGIIHTFKNYVLRRDDAYRLRMIEQLTQFERVMDSYLAEPLPDAEREALETIRKTIGEYEAKLAIVIEAANADWPAERTDELVRVDDTDAIAALHDLEMMWQKNRSGSTDRIIATVSEGERLIGVGFLALFALVIVALILGVLLVLLLRDMHRALLRLSDELAERRRLEQSEKRLAEAVEQSPATILITDTEGRIEYANRRFESLTGWRRDEIVGQTPRLLQSGDATPEHYAEMRDRLSRGESWHGVLRNLRRDGSSYWAETTIFPLFDDDGAVTSYIGIGEDVTEQLSAREQLARAQKMEAVGLLAGGIAHDFNNILTIILGAAHLAEMDAEPGSDLAGEIDQIDIAARRAQSLVRQLLVFARRQPGAPAPSDLIAIIAEVTRLMRAAIPPTIRIETDEPDTPVSVLADPTHLHQILMNLCGNAAEAIGGDQGIIRIRIEPLATAPEGMPPRREGWVRLVVADNGPGMSAETRSKVFDPFFTTKPMGKGTGLGLAVVQALVRDLGGRINVESEPGQGAQFELILPKAEPTAASTGPEAAAAAPRGNERILIVDDDAEVAATFRRFLMRLGYQVEVFTAPGIALERFKAGPQRFNLLISDMVMPGMNGVELAASIRGFRPDIPVIICTGYNPAGISLRDPAPIVLHKPVDPDALSRHVRDALDRAVAAPN